MCVDTEGVMQSFEKKLTNTYVNTEYGEFHVKAKPLEKL